VRYRGKSNAPVKVGSEGSQGVKAVMMAGVSSVPRIVIGSWADCMLEAAGPEATIPGSRTAVGSWKTCAGFDNREGILIRSYCEATDIRSWDARSGDVLGSEGVVLVGWDSEEDPVANSIRIDSEDWLLKSMEDNEGSRLRQQSDSKMRRKCLGTHQEMTEQSLFEGGEIWLDFVLRQEVSEKIGNYGPEEELLHRKLEWNFEKTYQVTKLDLSLVELYDRYALNWSTKGRSDSVIALKEGLTKLAQR
jgi:hypothetical protein